MDQVQELLDSEDYDAAIPLLLGAAEHDDAEAQNVLGDCYYYGWGVEQDYEEAVRELSDRAAGLINRRYWHEWN